MSTRKRCQNKVNSEEDFCEECRKTSQQEKIGQHRYNDGSAVDKEKLAHITGFIKNIANKLCNKLIAEKECCLLNLQGTSKALKNNQQFILKRLAYIAVVIVCVAATTLMVAWGTKAFERHKIVKLGDTNNIPALQNYLQNAQNKANLNVKTTVISTLISINTDESLDLLADALLQKGYILDDNDKKFAYQSLTAAQIKNDRLSKAIVEGNESTRFLDSSYEYLLQLYSKDDITKLLYSKYLTRGQANNDEYVQALAVNMQIDKKIIDFLNTQEIMSLRKAVDKYIVMVSKKNSDEKQLQDLQGSIADNVGMINLAFKRVHREFMNMYRLAVDERYYGRLSRGQMENLIAITSENMQGASANLRTVSIERGLAVYYNAAWSIAGNEGQLYMMEIGDSAIEAASTLKSLYKREQQINSYLASYKSQLLSIWNNDIREALASLKNVIEPQASTTLQTTTPRILDPEYIVSDAQRHGLVGAVKKLTYSAGWYYRKEFDQLGRQTLSYEKSCDTWRYFYDDSGRLSKITFADERFGEPKEVQVFIFNYVGDQAIATYKSKLFNTETTLVVNANGQIISKQSKNNDPKGYLSLTQHKYDRQGYELDEQNKRKVNEHAEYSDKYKDYVYDEHGNWIARTPVDPNLVNYKATRTIEYWN